MKGKQALPFLVKIGIAVLQAQWEMRKIHLRLQNGIFPASLALYSTTESYFALVSFVDGTQYLFSEIEPGVHR